MATKVHNPDLTRDIISSLGLILLVCLGLKLAIGSFDGYEIQLLNLVAINAILALSLNFIYGFSGMFSLGHAGFMAIGAYVSALLILTPAQKEMIWLLEPIYGPLANIHTSFFVSVLLGGAAAALFSYFIAMPVMRLGGDYLGIATLGFAEIIRVLFTNIAPLTNGAIGLRGIPNYAGNPWWNYAWLLITLFVLLSILKSNFGNVLKSIRDDEIAARTMGINTTSYRTMAFCIGGFFAGVGGALWGSLVTTIEPKMFNFQLTFNILLIVVAGGLGSITGSLVGSAVITLLLEWLRIVEERNSLSFEMISQNTQFGVVTLIVTLLLALVCLYKYRKNFRLSGLGFKNGLQGLLGIIFSIAALIAALELAGVELLPRGLGSVAIPAIPGMRMVIFSVLLMFIIIFRRQGLLGSREFSWDAFYALPQTLKRRLAGGKN